MDAKVRVPEKWPSLAKTSMDSPATAERNTVPALSSPGVMVQLGAWRDEAAAANGWNHIVGQSGGLLSIDRARSVGTIVELWLPQSGTRLYL